MKNIEYIFIAALSIFLYVVVSNAISCNSKNDKKETINIDGKKYIVLDKKTDTIYKDTVIYRNRKGKDILRDTTIYVPVEVIKDVDTAAILRDFFAKNVYKDTILMDKIGYVYVEDTISKNLIQSRVYKLNISRKQIDNYIFLEKPKKNEIYIGGVAGVANNGANFLLGGSMQFKSNKDVIYGLSLGMTNRLMPFGMININYKIGKK